MFYLTPAAIGYLTQLILVTLIGAYLLRRAQRPNRPRHTALLAGFFLALAAFIASLLFETALLSTARFYVVLWQNTLLGVALIWLLQFACHMPTARPVEARLALLSSGLYTLGEAAYAVYRLAQLRGGVILYRPNWADYILSLLFLWVPAVFVRQMDAHSPLPPAASRRTMWTEIRRRLMPLLRPASRPARTARAFALTFLFAAALNLFTILRAAHLASVALANLSISLGMLLALLIFTFAYLNSLPEMTSFIVKLSGVTLAVTLALLSTAGWILSPAYAATYRPDLPDGRALRFTPNTQGGYDVTEIPPAWETEWGEHVPLAEEAARTCSPPLDMAFVFYGQTYRQIYVCNDGTVSMGQPLQYRMYQVRYGAGVPVILPLLTDLYPEIGPGGVFVRQEPGRLIATWAGVHGFVQQQAEFTFQAVLYADGVFEFAYHGLPEQLSFAPNDDPGASVWAVGALPGSLHGPEPQWISLDALPIQGGPQGVIADYRLDFRQHMHALLLPLAGLIGGASVLIGAGFPLLFYASLGRPLNALLDGVQQMEEGRLAHRVPVHFDDEIGSLARSFNALASTLSGLIHNLGERVAERTVELSARTDELDMANAHLHAEMAARERAQAKIIVQQRTLAALDERTRLGRDLHDGLGQVLGYINVQTQAARALFGRGQTAAGDALLARLVGLAQQGHAQVREFILGMRSGGEEEEEGARRPPPLDFLAALHQYVAQCEHWYGQPVTLTTPPAWDAAWLSQIAELNVLRIVQEALTNALQHGQARRIEIHVAREEGELFLSVIDDGVGFQPSPPTSRPAPSGGEGDAGGHFGLHIMRERAIQIGGRLEVESAPGAGTRVCVRLPVAPPASASPVQEAAGPLRVLLADDQPIFLEGLRNLLLAQGIQVVGTAQDGLEAQELARLAHPDVVVMDLQMPRCSGLEATRRIQAEFPDLPILILTVSASESDLFEALKAGAAGYLLKNMDTETFVDLLFNLDRQAPPIAPELAARMRDEFAQSPEAVTLDAELSPQQRQVLALVAQGLTYREVGQELYLSEATIKYHMKQILEHLHLRGRQQAIAYARRSGLTD